MSERVLIGELMDDPNLSHSDLCTALVGLGRLNRFSFAASPIWREIESFAAIRELRTVRVLDIACGGGDILCELVRLARNKGIEVIAKGVDINPASLKLARLTAKTYDLQIEFDSVNALQQPLPSGSDIVICSLFLHHLSQSDSVELLKRMASASSGMIIVSDLVRSKIGHLLALFATQLLTRSKIVHVDGPRSVRAAWTQEEARQLAIQAGLGGVQIKSIFPCRFLLKWETCTR